ncbi:hypothetical protein DFH07DRAFT_773101 [Mycena maculata]|uniref:Uncharacterized protein n=1 Tax=Mycena maculata TaxID=230809 RepID=A0AAD7J541_9AGAR|nr:hypothetical protein DFH07DRAFT_773101 [Mycena maculata]
MSVVHLERGDSAGEGEGLVAAAIPFVQDLRENPGLGQSRGLWSEDPEQGPDRDLLQNHRREDLHHGGELDLLQSHPCASVKTFSFGAAVVVDWDMLSTENRMRASEYFGADQAEGCKMPPPK